MEKVLVLGATGGTGKALVQELISRGIPTIAFGRTKEGLETLAKGLDHPELLEFVIGDVFDWKSVRDAGKTASLIFQASNVPYHEMAAKSLLLAESVMKAAEAKGQKIVFVDGIYVYGPNPGYAVDESYIRKPNSKKGKIRIAMEDLIFSSKWKQSQALIVRLPDYYGPTSKNAYLNPTLESLAAGKPALFIGNTSVKREYIYLPDAAKMILNVALKEESYGRNWNLPGQLISAKEIQNIANEITGKKTFLIPVGKWMLKIVGLFDSFLREVVEMMYLTENPLVLSGEQYAREIGSIPQTPFKKGIQETFVSYQKS